MTSSSPAERSAERAEAVRQLIETTRGRLDGAELDRNMLDSIRNDLQALAANAAFWSDANYAPPAGEERQARYLIGSESPSGITLYLNVMRAGKKIPPHDHTTWACVAAVEGSELNTLYERKDDGSKPGHALLEVREVVDISPGRSVALMPDDIHSVEIPGDAVIRHLHFYGRPLETLTERKAFDLDNNSYKIMAVGVKTRT
nr:cysteine dioxygenase family protein [Marinicella sp. W31]MDC2879281.1 cysteine dioxygenase family protein [Marinicella sp. W31]